MPFISSPLIQKLLLIAVICASVFALGCGSSDVEPNKETPIAPPSEDKPETPAENEDPTDNKPSEPTDVGAPYVDITHQESDGKVDVHIDGQYFTSYMYSHPQLNKSILFPIISPSGQILTRGYPLDTREGESTDHTHHHGVWFNHGDVNGIDFWNAGRTPPKAGVRYGKITHEGFLNLESGDIGSISVSKNWVDDKGKILLKEKTFYQFEGAENKRVITHTTTLTALDEDVHFEDSKEALFAIRVSDELRIEGGKGEYANSEGVKGYPAVWGKRAAWMQLKATLKDTPVSVLIFDAPTNVNHPPHWMARDYGLYAVNNLGSSAYGDNKLNFVLPKNKSQTFQYQIIIADGKETNAEQINNWYQTFTKTTEAQK